MLLKVVLNTKNQIKSFIVSLHNFWRNYCPFWNMSSSSLYVQLLLYLIEEFLKTLHAFLLLYQNNYCYGLFSSKRIVGGGRRGVRVRLLFCIVTTINVFICIYFITLLIGVRVCGIYYLPSNWFSIFQNVSRTVKVMVVVTMVPVKLVMDMWHVSGESCMNVNVLLDLNGTVIWKCVITTLNVQYHKISLRTVYIDIVDIIYCWMLLW